MKKLDADVNEILDQCFQLFKTWLWGGYHSGKFEYDCNTLFELLKEFNPALANHYVKEMMDDWEHQRTIQMTAGLFKTAENTNRKEPSGEN